jgi:hypothetical protein
MFVVFAVLAVLAAGLLFLLDRALKAVAEGRRRRRSAIRLAAAAASAEEQVKRQEAAASASGALTTVLPAIKTPEQGPRHVA